MTFSHIQQSAETEQMNTELLITVVGFKKKNLSLPIKIQGDYHRTDIAESGYNNQIVPSPTSVKAEGMKLKQLHL